MLCVYYCSALTVKHELHLLSHVVNTRCAIEDSTHLFLHELRGSMRLQDAVLCGTCTLVHSNQRCTSVV
jgi:hypothetical protein